MNFKAILSELWKDSPVIGAGSAPLFNVRLDTWVLILAVLYGAVRLVFLCVEGYWKWKDRRDGKGK